jgi:hypothetical protein
VVAFPFTRLLVFKGGSVMRLWNPLHQLCRDKLAGLRSTRHENARRAERPRTRLEVEALDQRLVPSTVPNLGGLTIQFSDSGLYTNPLAITSVQDQGGGKGTFVAVYKDSCAAAPASQPSQHLQGSYTIVPSIPDTGRPYDLSGSGYIHGLGQVTATGELDSIGFVHYGHATGKLTLQNANGTVTLQLVGPSQPGFAPLPNHFDYTMVSATGAYTGMHGSGTIDLQLQPNSSGPGGTFTMDLHSQGNVSQNAGGTIAQVAGGTIAQNAGGTIAPIDAFFQEFNSMLKTLEAMELNMAGNNAQIEAFVRMFDSTLGSLESEIGGHPISI